MQYKKMTAYSLLCFFFAMQTHLLQAQKKVKRVRIKELTLLSGMLAQKSDNMGLHDFSLLAPNSALLKQNFSGFSQDRGMAMNGNSTCSILMGMHFYDKNEKQKPSPLLRVGLTYFSGNSLNGNLYRQDRSRFDTLTSSQTGETLYVDSVYQKNCSMNYNYEQLHLDVSLLFKTNPEARWSLFAGIGCNAGMSFQSHTDIYYNDFAWTETSMQTSTAQFQHVTQHNGINNGQYESFANASNFGGSIFVPLGVDFRIGKKSEFWKRLHLLYEVRLGMHYISIPELGSSINAGALHSIGVRVAWK